MLEEVVVIVWVEDQFDCIWTVDCSNGNVLCGIRKKLWTTIFSTSKSIVISEASTKANYTKVLTMLEEVVVNVWLEERLLSIWIVDCSNGNVLYGIRKNCEKQSCAPVNESSFLRLLQMLFKPKFQRC